MPIPTIKVHSADGSVQNIDSTHPLAVALVDRGSGGEPYLGLVGSDVFEVSVTPTITAGAYTAGDALGGLLTFGGVVRAAGGGGEIVRVTIIDNAVQSAPIDLVLFNRTFTPTADNAAFDPSDGDLQNCLGYIGIANTDYAEFNDNCVAVKASGLQMPFPYRLASGGNALFGQLVIRNGDTFAATTDITVRLAVRRDL